MSFLEMNQEKHGKFKGIWKAFTGLFDTGINGDYQSDWEDWDEDDTTQTGLIKSNIAELESLNKELNTTREKLAKDANNEELQKKETDLLEDIASTKTDLASEIETVQGWIDQSVDENGIPLKGYESFVESLRDIVTEYQNIGKSVGEVDLNNLNNYFSSTSGKVMKDYLTGIVKESKNAKDALKAFEDTGMSLEELGVTESGFIRYFEDVVHSANEAKEAINSVDGSFDGVTDAFKSENQGAKWDSMASNIAKAKELIQQGLVGTDDFQTVAKWMSPDIINEDDYKYDADAYVAAWQNAYDKVSRWFDSENPLQSMHNFAQDLSSNGIANITYDANGALMEVTPTFKNTAEAADKLGVSVNAVETAMSKLEEYGFEFDDVMFSGKGLEDYKTSLEGIRSVYESLGSGREKYRLGRLIENWDEELAQYEGDLSQLTEDQVVKIKFEYDMASLLSEIEKLDDEWENGNRSAEVGAARIASKNQYRELREENNKYDENSDKGYAKTYDTISSLQEKMNVDGADIEGLQSQIAAIQDLQITFQDMFADGSVANWEQFLQLDSFHGIMKEIAEESNITIEDLYDKLGLEMPKPKVEVDADTSKAENKINGIVSKDGKTITMNVDASTNDINSALEQLKTGQTLIFTADVDDVESGVEAVREADGSITYTANVDGVNYYVEQVKNEDGTISYTLGDYPKEVPSANQTVNREPNNSKVAVDPSPVGQTVKRSPDNSGVSSDPPPVYQRVIRTVQNAVNKAGEFISGIFGFNGTAHKEGTAKKNGDWSVQKSERALVGELGQETIVRNGKFFTVGDNGAEFVNVRKGDVIFNHKQSEELFRNGHVTSGGGRAKIAGGYASGTAFATGGRLPVPGTNGYGYGTPSGSNSNSTSSSNNSSSNTSDQTKEFNEKIDEIEILLDRMEKSFERLTDSIETYSYDLTKQSEVSTQAMNQIRTNLGTLQQAYNRYIQEANSVGLDESWKQKVQNGAVNIEEITDKDLKEKIDEYQKWYEKSISVQDKIAEMQKELLDLAVEKLDNIEKYFENRTDYNDNFGYLTPITLLQESLDKFTKELEKQVNDGVIKEGSNEWYESMESISKMQEKILEATLKKYQDIIDNLSRISDTLDNSIELKEARDEPILESDYSKQIDLNNKSIQEKYNKRQKLLKQQAIYDVGSAKYDEIAEEIADIDDDIYGLLTDIEELKDKIWEVRWQPFFDGQEALKDLIDETDTFRDLLDSDAFVGKNGGLTADGITNIALISSAMNEQKQSIKNYRAALEKLQEDYDKGNISAKEFKETSKEFMDEITSGVSNVEKYKDEIVSLYEEMLEKENDVVQKSIQKHEELLDIKKKNSDYDRNVRKQVKDINAIQAQISALQGVNNESAKAELKRLQAQLADAKDELSQTQKDREYDIRQQGYKNLSSDLTDAMNETLDAVKYNSSKQEEVISEMLDSIVQNYQTAYDKINQIIGNTGFKPSDDFQQNIGNLGTQTGAENQVQDSNTIAPNYKPDDFASGTNTGQIQSGSSQSNNDKIESEIEKEPNTTNRPVAQLTLKPTSISIQEGQSKNISVNIRPTDAANKTLNWKSSNDSVATVSNGSVKALKAGSCKITALTTDGSGISATVGVTVTAKPKPKPPAPKPSSGDGVIRVGDKVTFTGNYYSDSWGGTPLGNLYAGVPGGVVVDAYSGAEYGGGSNFHGGYAIHIKSADGRYGDLGWVMPSQISGYAKGTRGIKKDLEFAKINELGNELVIRRGGNDYTTLTYGSAVVPHDLSDKLFTLAKHTDQIINASVGANGGNRNVEVNNHYDSVITVNGNVDKDVMPRLERDMDKLCQQISKRLYKDAGLMGIQKKL